MSAELPASERKPRIVIELEDLEPSAPRGGPPSAPPRRPQPMPSAAATTAARRVAPPQAATTQASLIAAPSSTPPPPPRPGTARKPPPPAPDAFVGPPVQGMSPAEPRDEVCGVREVIEAEFGEQDGLILPVPALQPDSVLLEQRDGADIRRVFANAIELRVGERKKSLLRAADIRAQVQITDARLTVACSKYDKGGGWVGGPVAMIALNAGSKLLAARRRRGKMLVAQVRYPWIDSVYAQNKGGWLGEETMRVIVSSGGRLVRLELSFPKDVDATAVATELIRRAARFRLATEPELGADERARIAELSEIAPLVWQRGSKEMVGHEFPSCWPVGAHSAVFGLGPQGGAPW